MAFPDPLSITIGTVPGAVSLTRVLTGTDQGRFQNADQSVVLKVGTTYGSRVRHIARNEWSKIAADPITSLNARKSTTCQVLFDKPSDGFSVTELKDQYIGLHTLLSANSYALLIALLGGQN